jgi:5-enolpyruvylshikimate-3-phosphate synthase
MSLLVLGKAAGIPVEVSDTACIDTSFPGFPAALSGLTA